MSISMKNLEDRIIALENRKCKLEKIVDKVLGENDTVSFYIKDLRQYDMLVCFADCAMNDGDTITSGMLRAVNIIPVSMFDTIRSTSMLFSPTCSWTGPYNNVNLMMLENMIIQVSENGDLITIHSGILSTGRLDDNKIIMFGLKIYYIFRYNILGKFIRSINSRLIKFTQKFISNLF